MKFLLEPAYVLHTRHYRETSLIVQFFTYNYGVVPAIARSARGLRSRFKGWLNPFSPLLISCRGKTDLLQLTAVEIKEVSSFLQGDALFSALYLNELIVKLVPRYDPSPNLFSLYQETLVKLQNLSGNLEKSLRQFEKGLLTELGYGLQLTTTTSGVPIQSDDYYNYFLGKGLVPCQQNSTSQFVFKGAHLLAIEQNNYEDVAILRAARKLMRLALGSLLRSEVKSRELFSIIKNFFD